MNDEKYKEIMQRLNKTLLGVITPELFREIYSLLVIIADLKDPNGTHLWAQSIVHKIRATGAGSNAEVVQILTELDISETEFMQWHADVFQKQMKQAEKNIDAAVLLLQNKPCGNIQ